MSHPVSSPGEVQRLGHELRDQVDGQARTLESTWAPSGASNSVARRFDRNRHDYSPPSGWVWARARRRASMARRPASAKCGLMVCAVAELCGSVGEPPLGQVDDAHVVARWLPGRPPASNCSPGQIEASGCRVGQPEVVSRGPAASGSRRSATWHSATARSPSPSRNDR